MIQKTKGISDFREYCENAPFARSRLHVRSMKPTLMIFWHVSFSTHNMLDVNKQLKLKFKNCFLTFSLSSASLDLKVPNNWFN